MCRIVQNCARKCVFFCTDFAPGDGADFRSVGLGEVRRGAVEARRSGLCKTRVGGARGGSGCKTVARGGTEGDRVARGRERVQPGGAGCGTTLRVRLEWELVGLEAAFEVGEDVGGGAWEGGGEGAVDDGLPVACGGFSGLEGACEGCFVAVGEVDG